MIRSIKFSIAFLAVVAVSVGALAQPGPRELFESGRAAYRVGEYERAVEYWEKAFAMDPKPLLKYNLGQAYERLGQLEAAIAATENYLENTSPDDPNRGDAVGRLAKMKQRLEQTAVIVHSDVEGAIIEIDGEYRARAPRPDPLKVAPGQHTIVVRQDGYEEFRTNVSLGAGDVMEVRATLPALTKASKPPREPRAKKERTRPLGGWILVGAGGAAAVTGVALGGVALGNAKDAPASTGSEADGARTLAAVSDVLMFGGLAAAAGGTLWLILGKKKVDKPADAASFQLLPVASSNAVGFNLSGAF
jgi:tetratricopeptide (TPR) repeat protein